jgi:hypothetical protein
MGGQPGDKSPGYYRVSLRDEVKTGFQTVNGERVEPLVSSAKWKTS